MTDHPCPIRLLLIDDHPLVRDGLRLRLETCLLYTSRCV